MDSNKCKTLIPAAQGSAGLSAEDVLERIDRAGAEFGKSTAEWTTRQNGQLNRIKGGAS